MAAYFDQYSNRYKELLAANTGTDLSSAGFFAGQKAHHLRRALPPGFKVCTVLDYGCGIGMSLRPLQQAFPEARITGVDPSVRSLEIAAAEHRDLDVMLTPLSEFEADPSRSGFDVIVLSCVLHHIEADQHPDVLRSLSRRCSAQGRIAIFEHNPRNPLTRKTVRDCPFDEGVTLIPPRTAHRLLTSAGWRGVRRRYITFVPPALTRFKAVEDWLPWCSLGGQYMLMAQPA